MVGQHGNRHLFVHRAYRLKQRSQHALVKVFDSAFFQHRVPLMSGFVTCLDVEEYEVGITSECVNRCLDLALVVGIGKSGGRLVR